MYPDLSISSKARREVIDRFGLTVEAPTQLDPDVVNPIADRIITAHAPYSDAQGRLSIADVDDAIRTPSIKMIADYINQAAAQFPNLTKINMHCSPKHWASDTRPLQGDYDRLIDAIKQLSDVAAKHNLELMVENNRAYWENIPDSLSAQEADRADQNDYFGTAPEEWRQIQQDVNRSNVFLCLDPSHSCTYAQTFSENREAIMMAYLDAGDALQHVHWNGNDLHTPVGRQDTHMCIGTDTLPIEFHRKIKNWRATLLLEHFYSVEELETELAYIQHL